MHHVLRPAGAVAGLVLVALLCAPASAVAADGSSPRCAEAQALTDSGRPRDAAKLVDEIRAQYEDPTLCRAAASSAGNRIGLARRTGATAQRHLVLDHRAEAAAAASAALAYDTDNAVAQRVQASVEGLDRGPISSLDRLASAWDETGAGVVHDASTVVVPPAVALVLAVLLARLLLLLPPRARTRARRPASSTASRATGGSLAAGVLVVCVVASPAWLPQLEMPAGTSQWVLLVLASTVLLLLTLSFTLTVMALYLGLLERRRVRIEITDKGAEAKAGAAAIVAHLRAMGSGPPRGLEIPLGSDVQTLEGTNITAEIAGPFKALLGAVQSFLAVTPWRVLIDRESEDQVVVVISWHGRVVDTAVIRRHPWKRDDEKNAIAVDVNVMVAAHVLLTLLDAEGNYSGLSGARDWRSVGWQYDGAVSPHTDDQKLLLFSKAADADPKNVAALLSYRLQRYRDSTDAKDLEHLEAWLAGPAATGEDVDEPLRVRMLHAAYATRLNLDALRGRGSRSEEATKGLTRLRAAVGRLSKDPFKVRMMSRLDVYAAGATDYEPGLPEDLVPETAYALACFHAQEAGLERRRGAIGYLRFAANEGTTDVSLAGLRDSQEYRKAFGPVPRDLLEVEPFASVGDRLRFHGLTTAARITASGPQRLATSLSVSAHQARELTGAAALVGDAPVQLGAHRVDVVAALVAHGVADVDDLRSRRRRGRGHQMRRAVEAAYADRGAALPDRAVLRKWLYAYPASSRGGSSAG